ncbi:hypothetical protein [Dethiothermospora halolimnae]|uniref:hypothetical protein n=1 Tax=Dethiothermospora halolimnae TaxID=3114390 RepID=UPI003CCBFAC5
MNINSVKSNTSVKVTNPMDRAINILEKQKIQLQERISKVKESDRNYKSKQEEIKNLQEQIEQVNQLIHQRKMEKIKEKQNHKETNIQHNKKEYTKEEIDEIKMNNMISITQNYSEIANLSKVSKGLKNGANILKTEAKLDLSRGNGGKEKLEKAAQLEAKAYSLDSKISSKSNEINKSIDEINDIDKKSKNKLEKTKDNKIESEEVEEKNEDKKIKG